MNSTSKQIWVLAGGNGAGKSTFYKDRLQPIGVEFINADLIEKELAAEPGQTLSYEAAAIARQRYQDFIALERSFCFETVFSHESKIHMLSAARDAGYFINLVFIHLQTSELNEARVTQRVSEGGHPVPVDKIHSRIPRTLNLVKEAMQLAHRGFLFDNSSKENPFARVAAKRDEKIEIFVDSLPDWAAHVLSLNS